MKRRSVRAENLIVNVTLKGRPVPSVRWLYREAADRKPGGRRTLAGPGVPGGQRRIKGHSWARSPGIWGLPFRPRILCGRPVNSRAQSIAFGHPAPDDHAVRGRRQASFLHPPTGRASLTTAISGSSRFARATDDRPEPRAPAPQRCAGCNRRSFQADDPSGDPGYEALRDAAEVTAEHPYEIVAEAADGVALDPAGYRSRSSPTASHGAVRPSRGGAGRRSPRPRFPSRSQAGDDFGTGPGRHRLPGGRGPEESLLLPDMPASPSPCGAWRCSTWRSTSSPTPTTSRITRSWRTMPHSPHRVVSELRFIDILPYKQAYQYVEGGGT